MHVALSTWHWTSNVIVGLGLLAFGGIPYVLWGIFSNHCGAPCDLARETGDPHVGIAAVRDVDDSTNNWWVALLTFGEGWTTIITRTRPARVMASRGTQLDLNWMGIGRSRCLVGLGGQLPHIRQPASHDDPAIAAEAPQRLAMLERQGQ